MRRERCGWNRGERFTFYRGDRLDTVVTCRR